MSKWHQYLEQDDDDESPRQTFQPIKKGQKRIADAKLVEKKKLKPHDILPPSQP